MSLMETISGVPPLLVLAVAAGGYILGCFSTGYYLVRHHTGQDIRELGSGSTGARNAGRVLGRRGFLLTAAGDLIKGGLAVWLAMAITGQPTVGLVALLAVVMGHIWPVQLGLRGGKGVSTSLAGLLIYDWRLALIYVGVFVVAFMVIRRTVAASLVGFALLPWMFYGWLGGEETQIWGVSVLAALIILAHHHNIMEGFAVLWSRRGTGEQPDQ